MSVWATKMTFTKYLFRFWIYWVENLDQTDQNRGTVREQQRPFFFFFYAPLNSSVKITATIFRRGLHMWSWTDLGFITHTFPWSDSTFVPVLTGTVSFTGSLVRLIRTIWSSCVTAECRGSRQETAEGGGEWRRREMLTVPNSRWFGREGRYRTGSGHERRSGVTLSRVFDLKFVSRWWSLS